MEWIRPDDKLKPEKGKIYWVTVVMILNPIVIEARYMGNGEWNEINGNSIGRPVKIEGWWPFPKPEVMEVSLKKPYLIFPPYEVNGNGVNKKIHVKLLSDQEMRKIGFTDFREGYWHFSKGISEDIIFGLTINRSNTEDFRIDVLDDNFCQPYDYQRILSKDSYSGPNQFAIYIYNKVEIIMQELTEKGIIAGHVKGEYI